MALHTSQTKQLSQTKQSIYCPNCGSAAERNFIASRQIVQTQCPTCDYLMITCSQTYRVIEAYAPGISAQAISLRQSNS